MSMGMMMLPPVVVSLPFKLIFFVLVDGWTLVSDIAHSELRERNNRAAGPRCGPLKQNRLRTPGFAFFFFFRLRQRPTILGSDFWLFWFFARADLAGPDATAAKCQRPRPKGRAYIRRHPSKPWPSNGGGLGPTPLEINRAAGRLYKTGFMTDYPPVPLYRFLHERPLAPKRCGGQKSREGENGSINRQMKAVSNAHSRAQSTSTGCCF